MVNDMDYNKSIKKHSAFIAIGVILCVVLLAGTSYALFFQVNTNSENQVVKTGSLEISGSNKNKITVKNLEPMEDDDALANDNLSFRVTITNTGSLPANYQLKISKDLDKLHNEKGNNAQFVDLNYVKIAAFIGEEQIVPKKALGSITADSDGAFNIYTGSLGVEGKDNGPVSANVTIKVWLDKDTPQSEIDKFLYLKLDVESIVDEANTIEGRTN